jgi:prephenate dehydrogenase
VAASGFRDTTRIAATNVIMARDIYLTNQNEVIRLIEKFEAALSRLKTLIREGNPDKLAAELERAKNLRESMYTS